MKLAQLETDLAAVVGRASALINDITHKCDETTVANADGSTTTGRPMTDEEKQQINAVLAEGAAIKLKIDTLRGDAELRTRVEQLTGGVRPSNGLAVPTADRRSIGAQFTGNNEYQQFIRNGGHRRNGAWATPPIECFGPLRATTLTEDPASGGKLLVPQYMPGILPVLFKRLVVADLMGSGTATSNAIIYMIETSFTNAAAPVAEGSAKPESALVFSQHTDPVSKIAHWLPVTEELLEDVAAIMSYIDARLTLGVQLAEEDQLLNGNGTAPNILGLLNRPGLATPVARNAGATPPETNVDAILRQITAIATSAFVYPDGVVLNPANWFTIATAKTTTGEYLGGGPFASLPTASVWGTPVVTTPSIAINTALVGAFATMSQVFRKGGLRIEASNSHQDFFIKNLVAIRAEERLALAVYRPGAFGLVTGLN
jgi:HK97 family phage major capsid protein